MFGDANLAQRKSPGNGGFEEKVEGVRVDNGVPALNLSRSGHLARAVPLVPWWGQRILFCSLARE